MAASSSDSVRRLGSEMTSTDASNRSFAGGGGGKGGLGGGMGHPTSADAGCVAGQACAGPSGPERREKSKKVRINKR